MSETNQSNSTRSSATVQPSMRKLLCACISLLLRRVSRKRSRARGILFLRDSTHGDTLGGYARAFEIGSIKEYPNTDSLLILPPEMPRISDGDIGALYLRETTTGGFRLSLRLLAEDDERGVRLPEEYHRVANLSHLFCPNKGR